MNNDYLHEASRRVTLFSPTWAARDDPRLSGYLRRALRTPGTAARSCGGLGASGAISHDLVRSGGWRDWGDRTRSREMNPPHFTTSRLCQACRARDGDIHTAWDRPEPITWASTVSRGAPGSRALRQLREQASKRRWKKKVLRCRKTRRILSTGRCAAQVPARPAQRVCPMVRC